MKEIELLEGTENTVAVGFSGRITAENAEEISKELSRIRDENSQGRLVFDFNKLTYISSAGLRMLLKAAKRENNGKIKIINISSEVYEILEETGFAQMFDAHRAMKKYSSEGFELIGRGANGEVYRVDRENIIKLFQKDAPLETVERERALAKQALLAGLPTAISYSVVQVDDRYGILFELIDADTLSVTLKNNPGDYDSYTEKYIRLFKQIHGIKGSPEQFMNIKEIYFDAIRECSGWYSDEELNKLKALVESVPETGTLIHGDYHPNNIMVQDDELLLIDMGDMTVGHPIFDWLATAATQVNLVKLNPEYAEYHTKMPAELITKTWRRLFDSYFSDKDEDERKRIENQICLFSKLKVALAPYFGRGLSDEIMQASVGDAKANFLPLIDDLIGAVDW